MADIQSPTTEIRRGKKRTKPQDENIWPALLHRAAIKKCYAHSSVPKFILIDIVNFVIFSLRATTLLNLILILILYHHVALIDGPETTNLTKFRIFAVPYPPPLY